MKPIEQASGGKTAGQASDKEDEFDLRVSLLIDDAVDNYHMPLWRFLYGFTRNAADCDDILSLLWEDVLMNFKIEHITCYPILRRRAYQFAINLYRRRQRRGEILTEAVPEPAISHVSQEAYTSEEEEALKRSFWDDSLPGIELSEQQKEAVYLHFRYGFTYAEIGVKLGGVATSTISDWVKLARERIKDYINAEQSI